MTFSSLLQHTCQLGTSSYTTNSLGEREFTWTYSTTNTNCAFDPVTAAQRMELPGKFDDVTYRVFFESGATSVGNRLQFNSKKYLIKDAHNDMYNHHLECLVSELPV